MRFTDIVKLTEEQQLLSLHLAVWVKGIEHFGSTAIDGMTARPIIEEAVRYGDFKKQIVQKGAQTLLDYSNQKNEFVREVLARAKAWHKANT
ncbi:GrpB family protein [Brevibacillus formosus]|uniref:GrpB family protein n=1 Tax=Brevibacillus formosus TaxID=54913 RepID=UPI0018CD47F3|nr:GrpB family protein [Brevibacillus formosus]MBG9942401.1 hypothetical protein [Brevibacillus formosus]